MASNISSIVSGNYNNLEKMIDVSGVTSPYTCNLSSKNNDRFLIHVISTTGSPSAGWITSNTYSFNNAIQCGDVKNSQSNVGVYIGISAIPFKSIIDGNISCTIKNKYGFNAIVTVYKINS